MSVIISVIGSKPESDEYQCALRLKEIIDIGLPKSAIGEIVLHANATLMGQTVKDVDLMMMGTLQNYTLPLSFTGNNQEIVQDNVEISSFCTAIEIKSHNIGGIFRQGTEFYVKYGTKVHSVTTQSNDQKIATMNFFNRALGYSPFITNIIWFTAITKDELKNLLTIDSREMPSNVLSNSFSVQELMQLLVWQKEPRFYFGKYHFDSSYTNHAVNDLRKIFQLFAKSKSNMGELTRKRIEQITCKAVNGSIEIPSQGKMAIYRGRAGTGKTVGLIQMAIKLVDDRDARVLILTYNRALVSDIRRLFTLAELPDMFEESCVAINTMQSFFYRIIRDSLYDGNLDGEVYLEKYDSLLNEMVTFLNSGEDSLDLIKELMGKDCYLNWDYCLIDEAQDWSSTERDLIFKLFGFDFVIIADGGRQFVRNTDICDWSIIADRKTIKLKYCLRQKTNLVKFINHCLLESGKAENKILCADKMPGGKVVICSNKEKVFDLCRNEMDALKASGNIPYDLLFLVPSSMVQKDSRHFIYQKDFEDNGLFIWDGTNEEIRASFSIMGDEARLLQYDSVRGLEAWTVVCLEFDTFLEEKLRLFDESKGSSSLFLESVEDRKLKYLLNWILIPLTRAIDTIVITLKDTDSPIAVLLKKVAAENPDYITMIEED